MSWFPIAFITPQYEDLANDWLKFYVPGTTTALAMATDSTGGTQLAKAELDISGFITTDGSTLFIPHLEVAYDAYIFPTEAEADANDTQNAVRVANNINPSGVAGTTAQTKTLTDGLLLVSFSALDVSVSAFYLSGIGVDQGRLKTPLDYVISGDDNISLTNSYPEGTQITGIQSVPDGITPSLELINEISTTIALTTSSNIVSADDIYESTGYTVKGDGGGDKWVATGLTIGASVPPTDTDGITLSDSNGNEFSKVPHEQVKKANTMSEASSEPTLALGDVIEVTDRGGASFDVVLSSGVTPNTFNIVQSLAVATLSLSLRIESNVLNMAHWGVVEGASDSYGAIQAAIDSAPNRVKNMDSGNAWQVSNATQIWFPRTTGVGYYTVASKLKVPPGKNVRFHCESASAATLNYTGVGNVMIEFQPGGIAKSIGITNLAIMNGDVAVIGGNNGMVWFDQPQFYSGKNKALWFVDAVNYTDGAAGEYPSGGYTGPNESAGVNTVHVGLNRPTFHYCENGLSVESTTILLFRCEHPIFNATKKAPLTLDCIDARIIQPEIQSLNEWEDYGLINIPSILNAASYIYIEHPRFGAEEFVGDSDGLTYKPAKYSIVLGELGSWVGGNNITNLEIVDPLAFGNNSTADTQNFIYSNRRLQNCRISGGTYRNYQGDLVVENNFVGAAIPDLTCIWENNTVESSVLGDVFSQGGRGWDNKDEVILSNGETPTIATDVAMGTGGSVTIAGTSSAGNIVVNTGTGAGGGNICKITFPSGVRFNNKPRIVCMASGSTSAAIVLYVPTGTDKKETDWTLNTTSGLSDSATYSWDYIVIDA